MNNKQLIKVIKALVEVEVAKKQELFLSKTFPKILEAEVSKRLLEVTKTSKKVLKKKVQDPFDMANEALRMEQSATVVPIQENTQAPQRTFSKNAVLNQVLNQTTPFSKAQRSGQGGGASVLDGLPQQTQQPIVEENTHIPSYMDAEPDIDQTVSMGTSLGAGGTDALRAQMAHKMGYQTAGTQSNKTGLGVQTGLPGLDRILNRDNSELVKKFKR
tara:strand:+ start:3165 stop:3812 length:648 start_codon:yes stop_codon:yes gene_type:complete